MPGIIEGIAFMPPPREEYTEAARLGLGIRKLNIETRRQREEAASRSGGCFGCRSNSSRRTPSPLRAANANANANGTSGGTSSPPQQPAVHVGSSANVDGDDFDPSRPYTSYIVAVPGGPGASATAGSPANLLKSWTGIVILFAHGNAEDLSGASYYWGLSRRLGAAIVAYDYLGYGWSSGDKKDCTEENAFKAVRRMFDFVVEDCGKERSKVVVMGRSLGSGSATHVVYEECKRHAALIRDRIAKKNNNSSSNNSNDNGSASNTLHNGPLAGLILYSPLYSAVAATGKLWASGIFGDIMRNYKKVGDIIKHVPILIIHGTADEVIPFRCARELFVKCGGVPKGIAGAGGADGEAGTEDAETSPQPSAPAPPTSAYSPQQQYAEYLKTLPPRRAYFRPMAHCGHNDIEVRLSAAFYLHVTSFLRAECVSLGGGRGRVTGGSGGGANPQQSAAEAAGAAAAARAAAAGRNNKNNSSATALEGGGHQFQAPGTASKPVVDDNDPVWGRQP